jgi:hypothetical protein
MSVEEYNGLGPVERRTLLTQFQMPPPPPPPKVPKLVAYVVGAKIKGALQSNGARGNVFKLLQKHFGYYSQEEGIKIIYDGGDLTVKAYFREDRAAMEFQNALHEWEIHKELANLRGVDLDPETPDEVPRPHDLARFYLGLYDPKGSESPCQALGELYSYRLSVPVTEDVEPTTDLAQYQRLDKFMPGLAHYKCHLKSKAKFKHLLNDESNMVAASWPFHQMLDGLHTTESIPLVVLSVINSAEFSSAAHGNRYSVTLKVKFRDKACASSFAAIDMAKRLDDTTWETVVHVLDKETFLECVAWKYADTKEQWRLHDELLNRE